MPGFPARGEDSGSRSGGAEAAVEKGGGAFFGVSSFGVYIRKFGCFFI